MPISRARRVVAGESRPVISPVRMPMMPASLIPAPSCGSKTFISATLLSGNVCRQTTPGVRVPSTSIKRTRIGFARRKTFGGYLISRIAICTHPLEQLKSPEVVDVEDAFEAAGGIDDEDRGDFLFFHEAQSAGSELGARNGDGIFCHAIGGGQIQDVFFLLQHDASQIAIRDDAEDAAVRLGD